MPLMTIRLYKRHDLSLNKLFTSNMTLNSASSISIGSQHIVENKEAKQGGRYNKLTKGYCSGNFPNENNASREAFGFSRYVIGL